jgi:hypothetical protein
MAMADNPILEAALENIEAVVDTLTTNELVREIPVVGTVVKLLRGARDIRDRLFAAKLLRFIQNLESVSDETKERIRRKITDNPDEARKVGEIVIVIVERVTALEKADLIAILFLAYIDGQIDVTEFRRLCAVIDQAFLDDLLELLNRREAPSKSKDAFMQHLSATGLVRPVPGQTIGELGELFYEATRLARKLRHAYEHGRRLLSEAGRGNRAS